MHHLVRNLVVAGVCSGALGMAADVAPIRVQTTTVGEINRSNYYWQSTSVQGTAELLTLFCQLCRIGDSHEDVPVIAVLRDTLGNTDLETHRLTYVWLLSYARPNLPRRALSAVPFFYWRVGDGSRSAPDIAPLLDLSAPEHPMLSEIRRDVVQWTAFDPLMMPVRASTRAYRTNSLDQERFHLQEAISYLRQAPVADDQTALTRAELDTVIARLELRKKLLGGLVREQDATHFGAECGFEQERIRSRNWEILRISAERSGLVFEPLSLRGGSDQYAILWFRLGAAAPAAGVALGPVWKLLNLKNPWTDPRLQAWRGDTLTRSFDENGALLPPDAPGAEQARLVPLGVYSLSYPKLPLLLIDFRDKLHTRRHEMTQRTINEVTSGVIGISHFTNWYYYVAADLYDLVVSRHGKAMDRDARLDSYSEFRVALALDHSLDPGLRSDMQQRLKSLDMNPLGAAPYRDLQVATARYQRLQAAAQSDGPLTALLEKERRAELASFGEAGKKRAAEILLDAASFGLYSHLSRREDPNLSALDRDRRIAYQLKFLDMLNRAGTQPEVAYDTTRIRSAINELVRLMPQVQAKQIRTRTTAAIERLQMLSRDEGVQQDCLLALTTLQRDAGTIRAASATGIVASSAAVK